MYTEEYERRGFPFRNFILKLILVVIFVFLLIWLLPKFLVPSIVKQINESNNNNGIVCKTSKCDTSGIDALTSQIFSDNIEKARQGSPVVSHPRPEGGVLFLPSETEKARRGNLYDRLHRVMFNYTARVTFPLRRQRVQT